MLRIEKVNGKNVWDIVKLQVKPEQMGFVAKNETSLIEAYTTITGGGFAFPFGIYDGDEQYSASPQGLVLIKSNASLTVPLPYPLCWYL